MFAPIWWCFVFLSIVLSYLVVRVYIESKESVFKTDINLVKALHLFTIIGYCTLSLFVTFVIALKVFNVSSPTILSIIFKAPSGKCLAILICVALLCELIPVKSTTSSLYYEGDEEVGSIHKDVILTWLGSTSLMLILLSATTFGLVSK